MKKLSTLLIIIGILILVSPTVGRLYVQWRDNQLLEEWYNSVDAEEVSLETEADPADGYGQLQDIFSPSSGNSTESSETENPSTASSTQSDDTSSNAENEGNETAKKPKPSTKLRNTMGVIEIEKIKIKYPILEGVKESSLRYGIGHIPGTAGLGQPGNCALAGHRNYTFGRFFNRLDEVKEGDTIRISTKKEEFTYRVYKKIVVTPDDVSVIKGSKEDSILTLITCTPVYIASHRLIIHARLEDRILLEP